jgi:lipopolysaccharide transport system permease protein
LRWVDAINPLAHMVDSYRAVLIRGEWPDLDSVLGLSALATALLAGGMAWFRHASHRFADEL